MNNQMAWFLIGFLTNSVGLRLFGTLPMDNIMFPAFLLGLLVFGVILTYISDGKSKGS